MKNSTSLLMLFLLLTAVACKKDKDADPSTGNPSTSTAEFKCTFNGTVKIFDAPSVSETAGHTIWAGNGNTNDVVIFNLLNSATITSYYIRPWVGSGNPYGSYNFVNIDSGMVIITDTTGHKISGTFYFRSGSNIAENGTFKNIPLP
jgi:hypothetical protein